MARKVKFSEQAAFVLSDICLDDMTEAEKTIADMLVKKGTATWKMIEEPEFGPEVYLQLVEYPTIENENAHIGSGI